jgi:GNAT superfamily N-acetyltransferase
MPSLTATAISFQLESWEKFFADVQPLFPLHWAELARDQDIIKLGIDNERYLAMDKAGVLHVLTVRNNGDLIGYYLAFLIPHLHYKDAGLMAFTDIYFLLPEFRRGPLGAQLFIEAERTLKERGAKKGYLSCKIHKSELDHSKLFVALDWEPSDMSFTKVFR